MVLRDSQDVQVFSQRGVYWPRAVIVLVGVVLLWEIHAENGVSVTRDKIFLVYCSVALMFLAIGWFLWLRAPKKFRIDRGVLVAVWNGGEEEIDPRFLRVRKVPSLLYDGAVLLRAGNRWFVVFRDMDGFDEFMRLIRSMT